MRDLGERLPGPDGRWYLLVGLCLALVFTLQTVEAAVEGAWPHQRRVTRMAPRARAANAAWPWVALLVLPGLLLGILNVAVLLWREEPRTEAQVLGSLLVGLGWLVFVLVSLDVLRLGRYAGNLGLVGPLALILVLLVGDALLLIGLLDVLPGWETVRDALPLP